MRVTIKDKEAMASIRQNDLLVYLENAGWIYHEPVFRDGQEVGKIYIKKAKGTVRVMNDDIPDYVARMAENVFEIEAIDEIDQLQLFADITGKTIHIEPRNKDAAS